MKNPPLVFGAVLLGGVLLGGGATALSTQGALTSCVAALEASEKLQTNHADTLTILEPVIGTTSPHVVSTAIYKLDKQEKIVENNLSNFNRYKKECSK